MVGRPPKPAVLKVLAGNPGKRPIPQEIKPDEKAPECPEWLDDVAKEEWARIVPLLERAGLISQVDMGVLANYCQLYSRWKKAEEILKKEGFVLKAGKNGYAMPHPAVKIAEKAQQLMKAYISELGLSPVSRARLALRSEGEKDEFEEFLRAKSNGTKKKKTK